MTLQRMKLEWIVASYLFIALALWIAGQLAHRAWLITIGATMLAVVAILAMIAIGAIILDHLRQR